MITFNIILGVDTRKLCWLFDKPPAQTVGRVDRRKMPEILLRTVRRGGATADPAADTVRWSWPTPTTTRAVSPQEIIEVFCVDEGAAANLDER